MSGPDVPHLRPGDTVVLPLKLNTKPNSAPWRLIADEGASLIIPAIVRDPAFASSPEDGRTFLLHEIASTLIAGTRRELFAEAGYVAGQKAIAPDLMKLLRLKLTAADDRWSMIAAAFLSGMGVPRPTVADLRAGKDANGGDFFSGSLLTAVLQRIGPSQRAKDTLIDHLLVNSDIASWGVGVTLSEFAQEPRLTRELRKMLKARSPGALSVAYRLLSAGQKDLLDDATTLSFYYLSTPDASPSEFQAACWVIRDFGTDEHFGRLLAEIRRNQYRDQHHYDELWRNIIWSDNDRERAVLDVLLKDDRICQANLRYSDIARGELTRIQKRKQ